MSLIIKNGKVPKTPHTEFYAIKNVLALEEIHGSHGFGGPFTRKYHIRSYPTEQILPPKPSKYSLKFKKASTTTLEPYHILSNEIPYEGDYIEGRKALFFGDKTVISVSRFKKSMNKSTFFKNGEKYELIYVQEGSGILKTEYGDLKIEKENYIVIPKGTIYQVALISKSAFFFIIESTFPIIFPPHYMNKDGQATLMSSVVETEIETPTFQPPIDQRGKYELHTKHNNGELTHLTLGHHPFDIAGWEGSLYPFTFNAHDHHGIAREIHTAPPMRQTFQSGDGYTYGFTICTFRSQMEGWHPKDIPAPYAHSNVDSDEILFFSNTNYEARKGIIGEGSITLHPAELPHSPHGNAAERSIKHRAKISKMLAVMLDTFFEGLKITDYAYKFRDKDYATSWYKASKKGKNAK